MLLVAVMMRVYKILPRSGLEHLMNHYKYLMENKWTNFCVLLIISPDSLSFWKLKWKKAPNEYCAHWEERGILVGREALLKSPSANRAYFISLLCNEKGGSFIGPIKLNCTLITAELVEKLESIVCLCICFEPVQEWFERPLTSHYLRNNWMTYRFLNFHAITAQRGLSFSLCVPCCSYCVQ